MRIKIIRWLDENQAHFATALGEGVGYCEDVADVLQEVEVEIQIDEELQWNHNIQLAEVRQASMRVVNGSTILIGSVEDITEDGLVVLRLDEATLLLLEVTGMPIGVKKGQHLTVSTDHLRLFPVNN